MNVSYADGSLLAFWYGSWLVVAGFGASLVLAVVVTSRNKWSGGGLLVNTTMILAVLAASPLAMIRIGLNVAVTNHDDMGYISLVGTAVALALGLAIVMKPYASRRLRLRGGEAAVEEGEAADGYGAGMDVTLMQGDTPIPDNGALGLPGLTGQHAEELGPHAPAAWLHFKTGTMAGQSMPLKPDGTSIGRGEDNDIVINDATVSRQHALISTEEGRFFVEDQGSSTGTMVEGAAATRTLLASGATVQIGGTEAVFVQGEATNGAGTAPAMARQDPAETMMLQRPSGVMAWVAVTEGPEKGKTYQLKVGDNTIGRDPENDLVIEDSSVSRRLAMIRATDDGFLLVDMGSRGGTRVAGKTLSGKAIKASGVIEVGQTRLSLVTVDRAASPSAPASAAGETIVEEPAGNGGGVLIAQSGPDAGQSFPLGQGDNLIGRDPDSTVLLSDEAVSRRHAIIRRGQDRFVIFDLGSRAGTQVNGNPVGGHRLSPGERISLGNAEIVLMQPRSKNG